MRSSEFELPAPPFMTVLSPTSFDSRTNPFSLLHTTLENRLGATTASVFIKEGLDRVSHDVLLAVHPTGFGTFDIAVFDHHLMRPRCLRDVPWKLCNRHRRGKHESAAYAKPTAENLRS